MVSTLYNFNQSEFYKFSQNTDLKIISVASLALITTWRFSLKLSVMPNFLMEPIDPSFISKRKVNES